MDDGTHAYTPGDTVASGENETTTARRTKLLDPNAVYNPDDSGGGESSFSTGTTLANVPVPNLTGGTNTSNPPPGVHGPFTMKRGHNHTGHSRQFKTHLNKHR